MEYWITSNLGSILFKNPPMTYKKQDKVFTVLIWYHPFWPLSYTNDPLTMCSVQNCIFHTDHKYLNQADAVVVPIMYNPVYDPRWIQHRIMSQKWVFLTIESPVIHASYSNWNGFHEAIANVFNWSMTYRSDSDVPVPYGRTVPLPEVQMQRRCAHPITKSIPYWDQKQRNVLIAAMMSHCVPERMNYINELKNYIQVDIYGGCSDSMKLRHGCPGHAYLDCPKLNKYLFYLAFENSKCRQYITEKPYHNAMSKGAIPIVMGAPISDYEKLLPPHSFLHVNNYETPRDLATEILSLAGNDEYLLLYHNWRYFFEVQNEHSSFGRKTYELCRLCEALNYNDDVPKIYDADLLKLYFDTELLCSPSYDCPLRGTTPRDPSSKLKPQNKSVKNVHKRKKRRQKSHEKKLHLHLPSMPTL